MRRTDQQRRNISFCTRCALAPTRAQIEGVDEMWHGSRVNTFDPRGLARHPHEQRATRRVVEISECGFRRRMVARLITDGMPEAIRGRWQMRPAPVHSTLHCYRERMLG